jgi:hypothetical protein
MTIFGEQAAEQPPRAFGYRLLDCSDYRSIRTGAFLANARDARSALQKPP